MTTDRPFEELNLWQRIFAEHWESFKEQYRREQGKDVPAHWREVNFFDNQFINGDRSLAIAGLFPIRKGYS